MLSSDQVEPALLRQVDQVLEEFEDASEHVSVMRIDPADPASLDQYDALLSRLRVIYRDRIAEHEQAIDDARQALRGFGLFVQQQAVGLVGLRQVLAADGPARPEIDQVLGIFALRQEQLRQVEAELDNALGMSEQRPLPDYETARSLLAAALGRWADELYQMSQLFARYRDDAATELPLRQYVAAHRDDYDGWAQELAVRADPLRHLEPLELGRIARSLEAGETAIVFGPRGAAVIPSGQLMPRLNLRQRGSGEVTFDRRFRGEQAIAATIRSLDKGALPVVFLVHAQEQSLLKPRSQNVDFVGSAQMLQGARFDVREWIVPQGERPRPPADQPVVWVVLPPPITQRRSLVVSSEEQALIEAAHALIADGEPVLLSFTPSAVSRSGRTDPWPDLLAPFGLTVDTSRVLYERVRDQEGRAVTQRVHQLSAYADGHPIGTAVHGLQTSFDLPIAIEVTPQGTSDARVNVIAEVAPAADRWLEAEWLRNPDELGAPAAVDQLTSPVPLVVAAERRNPVRDGDQRVLVVGSGGWALSYLADVVLSVGGDRMVLVNPGNYELLLAGLSWLAGADDLIAASPVSRQVARLDGVTPETELLWGGVTMGLMPLAWLVLGVGVWFVRRG